MQCLFYIKFYARVYINYQYNNKSKIQVSTLQFYFVESYTNTFTIIRQSITQFHQFEQYLISNPASRFPVFHTQFFQLSWLVIIFIYIYSIFQTSIFSSSFLSFLEYTFIYIYIYFFKIGERHRGLAALLGASNHRESMRILQNPPEPIRIPTCLTAKKVAAKSGPPRKVDRRRTQKC